MRTFRLLSSVIILAACGGASDAGGTTTPIQPAQPSQPVVAKVVVSIPATSLEVGASVTAVASALDRSNGTLAGKTPAWTSDNTAIATVAPNGAITGVAAGATSIVATIDGQQGRATLTVVPSTKWTIDATVLTNADYGGVAGSLADVSVVKVNDGRYRMFIGGVPTGAGIASAISTDGITFTPELGFRIAGNVLVTPTVGVRLSHPFVMRLDDGRLRLYAHNAPQPNLDPSIFSFTSSDEGQTFTVDPGARLTASAALVPNVTGSSIVKVKTGGWRMYFSASTPATTAPSGFITLGTDWILSAFSTDLLTWTPDPGVRVGLGSAIAGNAVHPGAIANDDGSVTLAYFRSSPGSGLYTATSADGLVFPSESATAFTATGLGIAADPFLMRLPNGDVRMFYNWGDDKTGTLYVAHRTGFTLGGK